MISPDLYDLTTGRLIIKLVRGGQYVNLSQFSLDNSSWLSAKVNTSLFAVTVNGLRYPGDQLAFEYASFDNTVTDIMHAVFHFNGPGFSVDQHIKVYPGSTLLEMWPVITCTGGQTCQITRVDSFSLAVPPAIYELLHFSGDWGQEFEPVRTALDNVLILESRSGRSSKGDHPWFGLRSPTGEVLSGSIAWSGNWIMRFEPALDGGFEISGGLHDWNLKKDLAVGDSFVTPAAVLALGDTLNNLAHQYTRVGRAHWYPRNRLSFLCPVEWNHWWPYQDNLIDETKFKNNVVEAKKLGMEVCTLDAGWFGPSDAGSAWYDFRGDWNQVNRQRFPNGIRTLADFTHAHGMSFGLWCEIEGLGVKARLAQEHPEFIASRDGLPLGCVCFGNPAVQEWAYQTLRQFVDDYQCDWIKLDFNLDPGAGCDRADHGHGVGDGLYAHYMGYYHTLDRVRQAFPEVVLENCSSGGLRIDLGILRHTHLTFLSDPDWPVHDLQVFWGASQMIAPNTCLHWGFCEWPPDNHPPQQTFNPRDPHLTRHQLDYYTRISMLGLFGFSQKLPDLPEWVAARLAAHIDIYKKHVRRFIAQGELYHLTAQPRRSGDGDGWSAFQYSLPDHSEHLLFVFRTPGAPKLRSITLMGLEPERLYTIVDFEGEHLVQERGNDLIKNGLLFYQLDEEGSALLRLH